MNFEVLEVRKGSGNIEAFIDIGNEYIKLKGFRVVRKEDDNYFIGYPSRKGKDGSWYSQFLPRTKECEKEIKNIIMKSFYKFKTNEKEEILDLGVKVSRKIYSNEDSIMGRKVRKKNGYRYIDLMGYRFMTPNLNNKGKYSKMVEQGKEVTFIFRNKTWIGKVIDGSYKEV